MTNPPRLVTGNEVNEEAAIITGLRKRITALERAASKSVINRTAIISRASQSIPRITNTAIVGFSDVYDPLNWSPGTTGIFVPTNGIYLVNVQLDWSNIITGGRVVGILQGTTSGQLGQSDARAASVDPNTSVTAVVQLVSGERVYPIVWHDNPSTAATIAVRLSVTRFTQIA